MTPRRGTYTNVGSRPTCQLATEFGLRFLNTMSVRNLTISSVIRESMPELESALNWANVEIWTGLLTRNRETKAPLTGS